MAEEIYREEVDRVIEFSFQYGFRAVDIVSIQDMNLIAKAISNKAELPKPPFFYFSNDEKKEFEENVLSVFQFDWRKKHNFLEIAGVIRDPKMVFTLDPLHPDFDLEKATQVFKDYCSWYIHRAKVDLDIPLSKDEINSINDFYERENKGSYGPSHAMARAAGLWMWDMLNPTIFDKNREKPNLAKRDVVSALQKTGLFKNYSESSERVLYRLLSTAEACIEQEDIIQVA